MRIKQKREKTKTSLWNRQGNEEPIFPTKHWKIQHAKGNKNRPKQIKNQNNMDHSRIPSPKQTKNLLTKMKCLFPIPMNNIYRKEQEVSSKEKNMKSNARNRNSLWMQREYKTQRECRIYNSWPLHHTLHFHQKVSQKHTKIKIQSPGIGPTLHHADEVADRRFWGRTAPCSLDSGDGTVYG